MNITVVYGFEHKENTYGITQYFLKNIAGKDDSIKEFFMPKDLPEFCMGCNQCFLKGEKFCPHNEYVAPIVKSILKADFLIFASPVRLKSMSSQMKNLIEHLTFQILFHRPSEKMFSKSALIITTCNGSGLKSTIKDINNSLKQLCIGKTFKYGYAFHGGNYKSLSVTKREKINNRAKKISKKILLAIDDKKPSLSVKINFLIFRFLINKINKNKKDLTYWQEKGWLGKVRPWK